jgi:hypothetical protein
MKDSKKVAWELCNCESAMQTNLCGRCTGIVAALEKAFNEGVEKAAKSVEPAEKPTCPTCGAEMGWQCNAPFEHMSRRDGEARYRLKKGAADEIRKLKV